MGGTDLIGLRNLVVILEKPKTKHLVSGQVPEI